MPLRSTISGRRFLFLSLALLGAFTFWGHAFGVRDCRAASAPGGNLIFILDASGSMGAKIQGKPKIDIAKEVMSGLVKDLPAGINVGLVAYGHRQKADCNDVEELAPLGPLNKDALIGKIKGLAPKGKTPITISVEKVAESLKSLEDETTIVLVSDGEETCGGDPCKLVKELKESGVKFVMHVIGFDVSEKEKAQLECIAQAGGGTYFAAKNAGEFNLAAKKVVAKTEESSAKLKVKALRNGKPLSAFCEVFKADTGANEDEKREPIASEWTGTEGVALKLAPGVYDIKVQNHEDASNPVVRFDKVTIEAGKPVEKVADFSGGGLKVTALRNGKIFSAFCEVFKAGTQGDEEKEMVASDWSGTEGTVFKLVPGVYDLKVEDHEDAGKPTQTFTGITVEAGKRIEKVVDFSGGSLKVKALRNGKPFSAFCNVFKAETDGDGEKEPVTSDWSGTEGVTFKLLPGVYDLKVENHEDAGKPVVTFEKIAIEAGKSVEKTADFSGGALNVKALRNGKPLSAYCDVFKAGGDDDGEKRPVTGDWTGTEGVTFKLLPGTYDLIVKDNDDANVPPQTFQAITVEAGKSIEKVAEFSGGAIKVKGSKNGKLLSVYCDVYKAGGGEDAEREKVTGDWTGTEGATFKLAPGIYDLTAQAEGSDQKKEFKGIAVEAAKVQTVEVQF